MDGSLQPSPRRRGHNRLLVHPDQRVPEVGQVWGKLTILEELPSTARLGRRWRCRCICGEEVTRSTGSLRLADRKGMKSCCHSCRTLKQRPERRKIAIGQVWGRLTVIREVHPPGRLGCCYECRCTCGSLVVRGSHQLLSRKKKGGVSSCQVCHARYGNPRMLVGVREVEVGSKWGKLTVLSSVGTKDSSGQRQWVCRCQCGAEVVKTSGHLRSNEKRGRESRCNTCSSISKRETKVQPIGVGQEWGWLTVIKESEEEDSKGIKRWLCRCRCGAEEVRTVASLRSHSYESKCLRCRTRRYTQAHDWTGSLRTGKAERAEFYKEYGTLYTPRYDTSELESLRYLLGIDPDRVRHRSDTLTDRHRSVLCGGESYIVDLTLESYISPVGIDE
jgi:hypothetical protein